MSMTLQATDFGTMDQILGATSLIKQQIAQLTEETSSDLVSQDYAGLGDNARSALDLSAQIAQGDAVQSNISQASTIMQATQTALGQIESIASNFATQATTLETTGSGISGVAPAAQSALQQVAALLNTKVGDVYVFAGQDSNNPPVPDPAGITQSAFYQAIASAVAGLSANGASSVAAQTLAIASPGGTSPFSATLAASNAVATVDLGNGQRLQVGVLADQNSDAVSAGVGTTSTGSYTRDLMRSLATLGSLTAAQANDPNFAPLVQDTLASLQGAVSAINGDIGALGARQNAATTAGTDLADTKTALSTQLSNVQDADLTQVATQLSQAQTRLQASYQVIASLGTMSLAKFLPAPT
jgi:flagellar hook-associated protein 3 FlgL